MAEKVPRLLPGVDVRQFKLDPTDGFLLTRIDGKLAAKDLARETGLPDFSVARALEKLEKLAIIEIVDPAAPAPPPSAPVTPVRSAIAQFDGARLAPKYEETELDEDVELPRDQRKRVLDFYYRLEDLDHYTLLGVSSGADKKTVKRAYFELAAAFHPDRYFKKNLGSFKPKMEALFNRVTEAHDTLVDAAKRLDYDAYLSEVATTRGMEAMLERAMAESAELAAQQAAEAPPSAHPAVMTTPPTSVPPMSVPPTSMPPMSAPPKSGPREEDLRARREALARRLTGGRLPRTPVVTEKANPLAYTSTADAMEALKRRYVERMESATQAHAQRYVQQAEEALVKNDLVSASMALEIAAKFAPEDEALGIRAAETRVLADRVLYDSYLKQAQYEEKQGRWSDCARSWIKVARIQDDAFSNERAANAICHADDGDLHQAADHAKRAILLEPDNIEHHVTLVEVYAKAGLATSARRAAESALQLDGKHAGLLGILKRFKG